MLFPLLSAQVRGFFSAATEKNVHATKKNVRWNSLVMWSLRVCSCWSEFNCCDKVKFVFFIRYESRANLRDYASNLSKAH